MHGEYPIAEIFVLTEGIVAGVRGYYLFDFTPPVPFARLMTDGRVEKAWDFLPQEEREIKRKIANGEAIPTHPEEHIRKEKGK